MKKIKDHDEFARATANTAVKLYNALNATRESCRKMHPIPVSAAEDIAEKYGYDQVIIIARRVGEEPAPHGEHVTTYGRNTDHCSAAAKIGDFLKLKVMRWPRGEEE